MAAPVRQVGRKSKAEIETAAYEEAKKSFDAHWKLLRNVPGALPGLDDERPDPGCCFEVWEYQREVNPVEYNNPQKIKVRTMKFYKCVC